MSPPFPPKPAPPWEELPPKYPLYEGVPQSQQPVFASFFSELLEMLQCSPSTGFVSIVHVSPAGLQEDPGSAGAVGPLVMARRPSLLHSCRCEGSSPE